MMSVRLGAATLSTAPLDWRGNHARCVEAIEAARAAEVAVLCLPELAISGYGCEDAFLSAGVARRAWESCLALRGQTRGLAVAVGLPFAFRGVVLDAVALLVDGVLAGIAAKRSLAGDGVHYEPRWFRPWPRGARASVDVEGATVPVGDHLFTVDGLTLGFEICEEAWTAERPGGEAARRGADILLNPSASHFALGKHAVRERIVLEGARSGGVAYVYANLSGNEAGRIVYDGGALIATPEGLVARSPRLSPALVGLCTAVVDVDRLRLHRARTASFAASPADDGGRVAVPGQVRRVAPQAPASLSVDPEAAPDGRFRAFQRAVALGLWDHLRRAGARGWVVSLSGGADSAACAVLCADALRLAVDTLGAAEAARLAPALAEDPGGGLKSPGEVLATVYQATANSGPVTRRAAAAVAEAVRATHREWDVETIVAAYRGLVSAGRPQPLAFPTDDLALQNIQARARAPGVWLLANVEQKLLLTTSNRSEAAVGYATMDGDTAGGLAPLGGIDKAFLREWLRWREHTADGPLPAVPALAAVNAQAPTAELRPPDAGQTDESDLMPYPVLNAIEGLAIREKQEPLEVWWALQARFPDVPAIQLRVWVDRFFRLWCANQWKRERLAPSFHLDDASLDPRTWCRFPILSPGFAEERASLQAAALPEGR